MIAFNCPKCKGKLQRQDAEAGTKIHCPSCNQKLLVPTPSSLADQTMLGVLPAESTQPTLLGELVTAKPATASSPSPIRIQCPCCRASIKANSRLVGTVRDCPQCGTPVKIELPKTEPAVKFAVDASLVEAEEVNVEARQHQTPQPQEEPTPQRWYIHGSRPDQPTGVIGPFTFQELQNLVNQGWLKPGSPVCQAGTNSWGPASNISGLFAVATHQALRQPLPLQKDIPFVQAASVTPSYPATPTHQGKSGGSSCLVVGSLVALLIVGLCGGIGAVAFYLSDNSTSSISLDDLKTTPTFKGRLEAAFAVQSSYTRDQLLEGIAKDATAEGEVEVVKLALAKLSNQYTRDQLAEQAALRLAEKGKSQGATEIAKMISNSYTRDQILEKIAKPQASSQPPYQPTPRNPPPERYKPPQPVAEPPPPPSPPVLTQAMLDNAAQAQRELEEAINMYNRERGRRGYGRFLLPPLEYVISRYRHAIRTRVIICEAVTDSPEGVAAQKKAREEATTLNQKLDQTLVVYQQLRMLRR